MRRASLLFLAFLLTVQGGLVRPATAVDAPFDPGLMRLAEVLGSLHFLRNLCGEKGNRWREQMEKLLLAENPPPQRRAQFIANFNRGYRSFEGTYSNCTASAAAAIARYTEEGQTLSSDIATRFGN